MRFLLLFFSLSCASLAQTPELSLGERRAQAIRSVYESLRATQTGVWDEHYSSDVVFENPVGEIQGREALIKYYQTQYKNMHDMRFEFKPDAIAGDRHLVSWVMYVRSSTLNGGEEVSVHGVSEIEFQAESTQIIYQRDYFDMGEFLYENVPVLGPVIRLVKKQLELRKS